MDFWIVSSAVLLIVLTFFGFGIYYFYRQKFLNETQKDFIHNFTHEFKTPVSVISLAADVLKNPATKDKPDKLATYSGIVEYQASYLQKQIEKLLRFAYTESGHLHLSYERTNINELVNESIRNLAPLINDKGAEIEIMDNTTDPWIMADRDYIVIVITNLLDNAIKYSKVPRIVITTTNEGHKMILSVKDNGIGIEKNQIGKLFRKFFRVREGESQGSKGFGLGLAFVKKIVHAHKGKIRVESEPGKGSVFTIELPIK
jgi:two-component system phosphate regulon sensor histidine kinase PhoR